MDIGPLLPGRIPNTLSSNRLTENLQAAQLALTKLQEQLSTGKQLQITSDDPAAASRVINLQQLLASKTQVSTNIQTDKSLLGASDTALATIGDLLNQAKQLASAGIGDASTPSEKQGMAIQAQALIQEAINAGNSTFRGRYLFGGSQTDAPPFSLAPDGSVRYNGDQQSLGSFIDLGLMMGNNVDGQSGLGAFTPPVGTDINPALTLQTQVGDLAGGQGVKLGQINVTLVNGAVTQNQTIDLSGARSVNDIKALIEHAFTPGSVTVSINAAQNGLDLTPAAGTVAVSDPPGSLTAANLGIASAASAQITGGDLNPRMTLTTTIASLNGGTGIGAVAGKGLQIVTGNSTKVVDVSSATTVEDLLNILNGPGLNLSAGINAAGNGLAVSSRMSGVSFSIGENGGSEATNLGIRTFGANTPLADLNFGAGVPVNGGQTLQITRRDTSVVNVDLSGSATIQDVLNKINAVDPGHLVASLNTVGNGISLTDDSGLNPLSVDANPISTGLGLVGNAPNPQTLVGTNPNPLEVHGTFNVLVQLQQALAAGDNVALTRINGLVDTETARLTAARGELGGRTQSLGDVDNRVQDQLLQIKQAISADADTDITSVITELVNQQTIFQAALKSAAQTMQLSLYNYL